MANITQTQASTTQTQSKTAKPCIIFAGTPAFAATHLKGLHEAGFEIALVLTQPDAQVGRGRKKKPSAVKAYAIEHQLPIAQPTTLKDQTIVDQLQALSASWLVVVAYGLLLPKNILESTRYGCLNVHGSLLPRWRGAAPVQRAIIARDQHCGVCIMQMDEGLDTGPVRHQLSLPITNETSATLLDALAPLGVQALLEVLHNPLAFPAKPQSIEGVTYALKIRKEEKSVDWSMSALDLEAKIRALQPWPCVSVAVGDMQIKILGSQCGDFSLTSYPIGTITEITTAGIGIACGDGYDRLMIQHIQLAGGKPVSIQNFLNGKPNFFTIGASFLDSDKSEPHA